MKNKKLARNPNREERYTPVKYIKPVHVAFGSVFDKEGNITNSAIDLDPASCAEANKVVQAKTYYDKEMNGLEQPWFGNVFLNPPYGEMGDWVRKLLEEIEAGQVCQAILLSNCSTDTHWFEWLSSPHGKHSALFCFVKGRIRFACPDKALKVTEPRYPSVFTYLGENKRAFRDAFYYSDIGEIMKPVLWASEV